MLFYDKSQSAYYLAKAIIFTQSIVLPKECYMDDLWVVVCNASIARIYAFTDQDHSVHCQLIHELHHTESRLKTHELISDKPGQYKTREATRGAFEERTSPKEVEAEHFSH